MNGFISTRGGEPVTLDEAILNGLAPDGGLYCPVAFPSIQWEAFSDYASIADFARHLLAPFFKNSRIEFNAAFCEKVFNIPMPLHPISEKKYSLELFHGPTLSFKDFGARFFAACLAELSKGKPLTVLVATSGDTGSAVAAALYDKPAIRTVILFPDKQITARQQAQITSWGGQVRALAVKGRFDDCQRLVKAAFADEQIRQHYHLTTANSINIARLLPQMLFYAYSSVQLAKRHQQAVNFIVPSGNLGNVTACYWAREMGFPIAEIWIASNANHVLSDYWKSGVFKPQPGLSTLANAMDVGNPSNLERLELLFKDFDGLKAQINVESVGDESIQKAIAESYQAGNYLICPHTATGFHRLKEASCDKPWVVVATAHPAKFDDVLEPLLGINIPVPQTLQTILDRDEHYQKIEAELSFVVECGIAP